jgi:hypothetical protein
MADAPNILIATLDKNKDSEIRVALSEYRGQQLVDIRTFLAFTEAKVPMATKKGISLGVRHLPALVKALKAAEMMARELGLIGGDA